MRVSTRREAAQMFDIGRKRLQCVDGSSHNTCTEETNRLLSLVLELPTGPEDFPYRVARSINSQPLPPPSPPPWLGSSGAVRKHSIKSASSYFELSYINSSVSGPPAGAHHILERWLCGYYELWPGIAGQKGRAVVCPMSGDFLLDIEARESWGRRVEGGLFCPGLKKKKVQLVSRGYFPNLARVLVLVLILKRPVPSPLQFHLACYLNNVMKVAEHVYTEWV
ncbi:hypothetical protein BKA65DRAFT_482671 [Rhexocercosporidium sp. MPI-PUGE-AT-0058]|nr:hypothetical protein BKA65DRAFT_482671 [Rhexocercosporidium sp. MPI-PUGE-AT-0058]